LRNRAVAINAGPAPNPFPIPPPPPVPQDQAVPPPSPQGRGRGGRGREQGVRGRCGRGHVIAQPPNQQQAPPARIAFHIMLNNMGLSAVAITGWKI
jgi:hypothetical protein